MIVQLQNLRIRVGIAAADFKHALNQQAAIAKTAHPKVKLRQTTCLMQVYLIGSTCDQKENESTVAFTRPPEKSYLKNRQYRIDPKVETSKCQLSQAK